MRETTAAQIPLCPNLQQGQVRAAARAWGIGGGGGHGGVGGGGGGPGPESIYYAPPTHTHTTHTHTHTHTRLHTFAHGRHARRCKPICLLGMGVSESVILSSLPFLWMFLCSLFLSFLPALSGCVYILMYDSLMRTYTETERERDRERERSERERERERDIYIYIYIYQMAAANAADPEECFVRASFKASSFAAREVKN